MDSANWVCRTIFPPWIQLHSYTACSFTMHFSRVILLRSAHGSKCVSIMIFETSYTVCVSSDIDVLRRT